MLPLAQIVWDVSPILFELGPLSVRWYGALFATGFLIGFYIGRWMFRREDRPEQDLDVLLLFVIAGTVIGARLGHVFFYHPEYYLLNPGQIIRVWEGGLASHGGALGILVAIWLYSRNRPRQPFLWVLDRLVVPTALVGSLIRIGNLFNSEILGLPADVPWAIVFARIDMVPRHPVQLYESITYFFIFIGLLLTYRRAGPRLPHGLLSGLFLVSVFSARFVLEFFKMEQASFDAGALSVGQWLSVPMVLLGLYLLYRAVKRGRPAKGTYQDRGRRRIREG